jgi:hypothetical protein
MPKFIITYHESYAKQILVEAENKDEATEAASELLNGEGITAGKILDENYKSDFLEWTIEDTREITE